MTEMVFKRDEEETLTDFLESKRAEFLAVYGRRRVGKTFLINAFFEKKKVIFFKVTGSKNGERAEQLGHFIKAISETFYHGVALQVPKTWDDAFELLTNIIKNQTGNLKIILFFDEFPWMATKKSRLKENLSYYWNQHWENDHRIKLIICGSSASWIINNIINDTGGLHNRITKRIILEPLNLTETKQFLLKQGVKLNHDQLLQLYIAIGGIPYYLTQVKKGLSATQNIQQLAFKKNGILIDEFNNLFSSLFKNHEVNIEIIRTIASRRNGISQEMLFKKIGGSIKGKLGVSKLQELEDTGFIIRFMPFSHKKKGVYFKVIDEYTLFYLKWIEPVKKALLKNSLPTSYWQKQSQTPAWYSWSGLAFESVCYKHIGRIQKTLKLNALALAYTWRTTQAEPTEKSGAQVDLLFDRDDDAITLCEIKYTDVPFVIDKQYAKNLENKKDVFIQKTKTKKQIFFAFISAHGLKKTIYSEDMVDGVVTLDDLFE